MIKILNKIFNWAKCKHEKLRVIGYLPKAYIVKCSQCGQMRSLAKDGAVNPEPMPKLAMEMNDDDVQY